MNEEEGEEKEEEEEEEEEDRVGRRPLTADSNPLCTAHRRGGREYAHFASLRFSKGPIRPATALALSSTVIILDRDCMSPSLSLPLSEILLVVDMSSLLLTLMS